MLISSNFEARVIIWVSSHFPSPPDAISSPPISSVMPPQLNQLVQAAGIWGVPVVRDLILAYLLELIWDAPMAVHLKKDQSALPATPKRGSQEDDDAVFVPVKVLHAVPQIALLATVCSLWRQWIQSAVPGVADCPTGHLLWSFFKSKGKMICTFDKIHHTENTLSAGLLFRVTNVDSTTHQIILNERFTPSIKPVLVTLSNIPTTDLPAFAYTVDGIINQNGDYISAEYNSSRPVVIPVGGGTTSSFLYVFQTYVAIIIQPPDGSPPTITTTGIEYGNNGATTPLTPNPRIRHIRVVAPGVVAIMTDCNPNAAYWMQRRSCLITMCYTDNQSVAGTVTIKRLPLESSYFTWVPVYIHPEGAWALVKQPRNFARMSLFEPSLPQFQVVSWTNNPPVERHDPLPAKGGKCEQIVHFKQVGEALHAIDSDGACTIRNLRDRTSLSCDSHLFSDWSSFSAVMFSIEKKFNLPAFDGLYICNTRTLAAPFVLPTGRSALIAIDPDQSSTGLYLRLYSINNKKNEASFVYTTSIVNKPSGHQVERIHSRNGTIHHNICATNTNYIGAWSPKAR